MPAAAHSVVDLHRPLIRVGLGVALRILVGMVQAQVVLVLPGGVRRAPRKPRRHLVSVSQVLGPQRHRHECHLPLGELLVLDAKLGLDARPDLFQRLPFADSKEKGVPKVGDHRGCRAVLAEVAYVDDLVIGAQAPLLLRDYLGAQRPVLVVDGIDAFGRLENLEDFVVEHLHQAQVRRSAGRPGLLRNRLEHLTHSALLREADLVLADLLHLLVEQHHLEALQMLQLGQRHV
mmetsp:Transcript_1048/g.2443  ORF Transcript_1048/g.2443 Transcript_1048/m.2443 type:complete len:233 (-) Transcript_1048:2851-3549(-)